MLLLALTEHERGEMMANGIVRLLIFAGLLVFGLFYLVKSFRQTSTKDLKIDGEDSDTPAPRSQPGEPPRFNG
jgi:hypothetical protein